MPLKFKIKKNDDCKIQPSASKNQLGYVIVGPNCGRNKKGIFNCECGKCKELVPDKGIKETERIVNISELEKMIQKARLDVIALKNHTEKKGDKETTEFLSEIADALWKCENFEFILERRKIKVSPFS